MLLLCTPSQVFAHFGIFWSESMTMYQLIGHFKSNLGMLLDYFHLALFQVNLIYLRSDHLKSGLFFKKNPPVIVIFPLPLSASVRVTLQLPSVAHHGTSGQKTTSNCC